MAESNKNYFDALPDEIILKILCNLDGLANRSNVAQVSHRFNRLSKDKYWRRSIFISMLELERFSIGPRCKFVEQLMKELEETTSKRLEMLTIEFSSKEMNYSHNTDIKELLAMIKSKMKKLSNLDGTFMIRSSDHTSRYMFFFTPKFADADNGRLFRYLPLITIFIRFDGKETTKLQKVLEFSREDLKEASLKCPITLTLLRQLGECKSLERITLIGELILPPYVNEMNLPKMNSRVVDLWKLGFSQLSDQTSNMAVIFFSDVLSHFYVPFALLRGSESEIFSSCPNLKFLNIIMENDAEITDEEFSYFCDKLIYSMNNHSLKNQLNFSNVSRRLSNILYDSMNTNLTKEFFARWFSGDDDVTMKLVEISIL